MIKESNMADQIEEQDVELLDESETDLVEKEAHDPKNAEAQSVASVDAAEKKGPVAKKRKGDKGTSEPMQKGDAGAMKAESVDIDGDFSEDLNALVESEATLSDEFKAKTAVIFEAAVKVKLSEEIDRLEAQYAEELAEEVGATKSELVEKVDSYLNYVVDQWMEDNAVAVQTGLRTEIAEGFMSKLKDVFVESYIEVPESKVDLVDDLAEQVEELEASLNATTERAIHIAEELETYKRDAIIAEATRGLAITQAEKLAELAENVEFDNVEIFTTKVATLKETYFKAEKVESSIIEDTDQDVQDEVSVSAQMSSYINAIKKSSK